MHSSLQNNVVICTRCNSTKFTIKRIRRTNWNYNHFICEKCFVADNIKTVDICELRKNKIDKIIERINKNRCN
jgi:hypothetical protein